MEVYEFAEKYLKPYKVNGAEIIPEYCPYCHGGSHRDKYSFALNAEKKTFNCKRGHCGKQGHFTELLMDFGEAEQRTMKQRRVYKKPQTKINPVNDAAEKYLLSRGISLETQKAYRIGTDEKGNIVFPYYDPDDILQFVKFRPSRPVNPGERKAWREKDTKPVLFGMHLCDPKDPLTIQEGEVDALSGHEAGLPNCVSVPSGAEDLTWLDTCWDFLKQFDRVVLYGDNDDAGFKMIRELTVRLPNPHIMVVLHDRKDANEELCKDGPEALRRCWSKAEEVPAYGLIDLADVTPLDMTKIPKVASGIAELDRAIGGFMMGDVSVWTAKRGSGKSTLLSQVCLEAVQAGERVCVYSGELRAERFQSWFHLQAAGSRNIREYFDTVTERTVPYVPRETADRIREWYRGRIYIYDNAIAEGGEASSILKVFEVAAKRYNCRVFLVDNLMTAQFEEQRDSNYYRAQSAFVGKLVEFANRYNVHVHLVAHPRKTNGELENDDVAGSGDITNRAANVFGMERVPEDKKNMAGFSTGLKILKNRWDGATRKIGLNFDPVSRRFYATSGSPDKHYGWEADYVETHQEEMGGDMPW